ncbi:hypothetical protein, partial [Salibacter sp.]|uniref:hypothetical protein n=1 Tax=Salibacter sp. TaxID=2010995 RepID=UPI00287050ED
MKRVLLLILFTLALLSVKAQSPQHGGQANNWSIAGSNHEWLNFNGLTATPFQLPNNNHFNVSGNPNNSVSDKDGNLMFYIY